MGTDVLGGFEHQILLAILRLGSETYSVPIVLELERQARREVSPAAVYIALRRLEKKGLLDSRIAEASGERGGRPRRYFKMLPEGVARLRAAHRQLTALADGLDAVLGAER